MKIILFKVLMQSESKPTFWSQWSKKQIWQDITLYYIATICLVLTCHGCSWAFSIWNPFSSGLLVRNVLSYLHNCKQDSQSRKEGEKKRCLHFSLLTITFDYSITLTKIYQDIGRTLTLIFTKSYTTVDTKTSSSISMSLKDQKYASGAPWTTALNSIPLFNRQSSVAAVLVEI